MIGADDDGKRPGAGEGDDVPLPGGGVLHRGPAPVEQAQEPELPLTLEAIVKPFFLMGLAALGVLPHPDHDRPQVDLAAARMAIAALELLRDKTAGNVSDDERRLIDQVLIDLKMQYVEARGRA
ncbi:MAG: DUF1844 domain-containing protein [Acidobacteria bacterium]|jgi:hypothetical protein|nr:DUF1844 domain-containing protein [Acidobacteriota bacterium]